MRQRLPAAPTAEILDPVSDPLCAQARLRIRNERGEFEILAATFSRAEVWTREHRGFWFSQPVLFLRSFGDQIVAEAVDDLSRRLGGYWLRYYRWERRDAAPAAIGNAAVREILAGAGVVDVTFKDGREFSLQACLSKWWNEEAARRSLPYYFGPSLLFLDKMDAATARRAVKAMADLDEQLFCRYDTPRRTLPEILDAFAAALP